MLTRLESYISKPLHLMSIAQHINHEVRKFHQAERNITLQH